MKRIILSLIVIVLSGCVTLPTGPSVPMSPAAGKPYDLYLAEDGKCRQLAERQLGKDYEYFSTQEAQYHYDNVYVQCMHSNGNLFVQPPAVYRRYRSSRPSPQDYNAPPPPQNYNGPPPQDYYNAPPPQDYNAPPPGNYSVPPPDTPPPPN